MTQKHFRRIYARYGKYALLLLAVSGLVASEHRGVVKSKGLPVPGATITATQGDAKQITTTDDQGGYAFPNLPDGIWSVQVEMLGFQKTSRDIGVAPDALSPQWDLKLEAPASAQPAIANRGNAPAPAAERAPAPERAAATQRPAAQPPQTAAASPATPGGRGGPAATANPQTARAAGGRQANAAAQPQATRYQQLDVTQSADTSLFGQEGMITAEANAELSPSANESYVVQGSQSSALGLPGQNDWGNFGGRGMMGGPDMMGMGGRGEGEGAMMPGAQTDGQAMGAQGGAPAAGGPGGGGPGGGGPGMAGGRGGAMAGGAGGGRGGAAGGAAGGRGGAQAGRGPAWAGMNNARAFGNNRRDPRMMYTGNLAINEANSVLNAREYSLTGQNILKPYSNNTGVNVSIGGPLIIPKLLDGRTGQFTLNIGVTRSRNGSAGNLTTVPTDLERLGNFSQSSQVIYDPATGAPFQGNIIPVGLISPIAKALLAYYPHANLPGSTQNYQLPVTSFRNSNTVNARVNQTLNSKNRIGGGIGYSGNNSTSSNMFGFTDATTGRGINANATYAHNFAARLVGNLNFTFSRNRTLTTPYFASLGRNIAGELGIGGVSTDPLNWGPPSLSFSNYANMSDAAASLNRSQTSSLTASLMWVRGSHNMSMGGDFRRQQINRYSDSNGRGSFGFNGYATSLIASGAAVTGTGYDLADFLLGVPDTASVRYGTSALYFRGSMYDAFIQDDWRMNARLSLNLGLRWEYQAPMTEKYNRLINLQIAPNFTAITAVQAGSVNPATGKAYTAGFVKPDWNNFSPRIGIAWRPSAKLSTVLRAGYGIYFNSSAFSQITNQMAQQPPLASAVSLNIKNSPLLRIANAFTSSANVNSAISQNTYALDPNYHIGYVHQWNFAIQQNLPYSFQTSLSYQGSKGTGLDREFLPWVTPPNAAAAPYPSGYVYQTNGGNSIYNAASVMLTRRFRGGLTASANYVFSKSIDSGGAGGPGAAATAQNWLDLSAERGLSSFDQRHSLGINFSFSTGQGRRGGGLVQGWKGQLLKDWTITSQIQVRSSSPMTATLGGNQTSSGALSQTLRAQATGVSISPVSGGTILNAAAFTTPAAGTWGNAGRNTIPGPIVPSLNASAGRVFRIGERHSVDLQLRANNALNTVVITRWNTALNTTTFGHPTGVNAMRSVTASLRFRF